MVIERIVDEVRFRCHGVSGWFTDVDVACLQVEESCGIPISKPPWLYGPGVLTDPASLTQIPSQTPYLARLVDGLPAYEGDSQHDEQKDQDAGKSDQSRDPTLPRSLLVIGSGRIDRIYAFGWNTIEEAFLKRERSAIIVLGSDIRLGIPAQS